AEVWSYDTQLATGRDAHDHRSREIVAGAVPQHRHLVAYLHHGGPDVVEELDFDDRFEPPHRHADCAPDDARLRQRRVENTRVAVQPLQTVSQLEHAALAGYDR